MFSERERIAHVVRRLGIGGNPKAAADLATVEDALSTLVVFGGAALPPDAETPGTWADVDYDLIGRQLMPWWMDAIVQGRQPLTERLVWFWHDHLAVSGVKVGNPYVLWKYHTMVRTHATGNFAELLHAVSQSAAMLRYLDGEQNAVDEPNENFAREVMELHTIGLDAYTQGDVAEVARAASGWVVNEPHWEEDRFTYPDAAPWAGVFDPERHDPGPKQVLGTRKDFDLPTVVDHLLAQPSTGRHVAAKLYRELVGLDPDPAVAERLGSRFASDYEIAGLVEDIVSAPAFLSEEAIRSRVRTPLEKAATVMQGLPIRDDFEPASLFWMLDQLNYLPLHPPNPAGFPAGGELLDPARLLGAFDFLHLVEDPEESGYQIGDPFAALGLFDVSAETRLLVERFSRPGLALGLAFGSPEFQVV